MQVTLFACVLCVLCHSVSPFFLKASTKTLTFAADESLTLKCLYSPEETFTETKMFNVTEMRLVRRVGKRGWQTLAQIWVNDQEIKTYKSSLDVTGQIGKHLTESNLNTVWYHTSPDALGTYRCDVVGTDKNNDMVLEKTNLVNVFDKNATTGDKLKVSDEQLDNLRLEFNRYKSDTEEKLRGLRDAVSEFQANKTQVTDVGQQLRAEMEEQFKVLRENFSGNATACGCQATKTTGKVEETTTKKSVESSAGKTTTAGTTARPTTNPTTTKAPTTTPEPEPEEEDERGDKIWPHDQFALPKPESGCPQIPEDAIWASGYIRYHTESKDENLDKVSDPSHLAGPVSRTDGQGNNTMFLHFCVKSKITTTTTSLAISDDEDDEEDEATPLQWPAGSYCISRVGGRCPRRFSSGYIDVDEEDMNHLGAKVQKPHPDILYFCCRKDAPASRPVRLPAQKSFFLFRFGGRCQTVKGMRVSEESVTLDTENVENADEYENQFHPDGHIQDVHLELCYYTPLD